MKGYFGHIENDTLSNDYFRKVLFTGPNCQLVLMTLKPGEQIGAEVHQGHDQFFRFESGEGKVIIGQDEYGVKDGDSVIVPAGENHNIINTSMDTPLKLYTIYSPPEHPDGTVHKTAEEAKRAHEHDQ
jgi:mannose-6-phosphate isomerase-like protein (cupin superfamily)